MAVSPSTAASPAGADVREVAGIARLGKRTKHLVKRLRPGDVAIIDHRDLDRVSGEDLVACGVAGVVNCSPSSAGGYPNMGPLLLVQAGVQLVDVDGPALFDQLQDGDPVVLRDGEVWRRGERLATGELQSPAQVQAQTDQRRADIGEALEAFAENTVRYMVEEKDLLAGRLELPRFDTDFRDRPVLIVVRGVDHKRDIKALRPYIRDVRPVLIGVDGGADALLQEGFKPDMIVGDMDSAADATLRCGAELVVHAYPDGRAPGREHLESLGLEHKVLPAPGTSQDIAMLIAAERGAELIVSVGSHFNLVEFLDKNRRGMASTFLTRLRIGEILVDAKGVSRLYRPRPGLAPVLLLAVTGLVVLLAVVLATPGLKDVADLLWLKLQVLLGISARPPRPSRSMLNFRYHALSLVAVFLALVVGLLLGVAIGDKGLVSSAERDVRASLRHDVRSAQDERDAAREQLSERERFEQAAYPALVAGRLDGRRLALIELGDGSDRMWDLTRDALQGSGAKLTSVSVIRLPLDLGALASGAKGTRYQALGESSDLLHAFGTRVGIQFTRGGDLLAGVRRELLVQGSGTLDGADGVVLVHGTPELDDDAQKLADTFEDGLVTGLRADDIPVVGVETTDADPSQIGWFKDHELSSVDDLDDPIGRAALVFALGGQRGSFGVKSTADGGRLPPILQ